VDDDLLDFVSFVLMIMVMAWFTRPRADALLT
jgi:hypothetical protein